MRLRQTVLREKPYSGRRGKDVDDVSGFSYSRGSRLNASCDRETSANAALRAEFVVAGLDVGVGVGAGGGLEDGGGRSKLRVDIGSDAGT